jgi:hypothetical protein
MLDGVNAPWDLLKFIGMLTLTVGCPVMLINANKTKITTPVIPVSTYIQQDYSDKNAWKYLRVLTHFNTFNHWIIMSGFKQSVNLYRYWDKGLLQL